MSSIGTLSAGVWYTGLLYKNNTIIEMTRDDLINVNTPFDFGDFPGTYFASKRLAAAIGWEHPSIAELLQLNMALIAQFDLNDNNEQLNSQYLVFKAGIPVKNFTIEAGGSIETLMRKTEEDSDEMKIALAGEAGLLWLFPGEFASRLSFNVKIASGGTDGLLAAFVPVTSKYFGYILQNKMSGLSILSLDYSNRLNRVLGMSLNAGYFIRNDLATFAAYPLISSEDSDGYFLGPEFNGRLTWSPLSDMQFNLGGGAFIPALGNAASDQKIKWRADLTAVFAF